MLLFYGFAYYFPDNFFGLRHGGRASGEMPLAAVRECIVRRPQKIILGDSRFAALDLDYIEEITGDRYCNFAFAAADFSEMEALFWFAAERCELKEVVFTVGWYTLKGDNYDSRITDILNDSNNLSKHLFILDNWSSAYHAFEQDVADRLYFLTHGSFPPAPPPSQPQAVAPHESDPFVGEYRAAMMATVGQLYNAFKDYAYNYSRLKIDKLQKIIDYCSEQAIELKLVFPPMPKAMYEKIILPFGYDKLMAEYKGILQKSAVCYDFEWAENAFTVDPNAFFDALHLYQKPDTFSYFTSLIFDDNYADMEQYVRITRPQ